MNPVIVANAAKTAIDVAKKNPKFTEKVVGLATNMSPKFNIRRQGLIGRIFSRFGSKKHRSNDTKRTKHGSAPKKRRSAPKKRRSAPKKRLSAPKKHRSAPKKHRSAHKHTKNRSSILKARKSRCNNLLKKKISINMRELKKGKFKSRAQAIAVSYSQVKKKYPSCAKMFKR